MSHHRTNTTGIELFTCPAGHKIPHTGPGGECTPIRCGGKGRPDRPEGLDEEDAKLDPRALALMEKAENNRLARAETRVKSRMSKVKVPDLKPEEVEGWVNQKLQSLTPYAAAEYEFQLMYGDDKTRKEIADSVFDRTGHSKGERANIGGAVIILAGGTLNVPWAQTTPPANKPGTRVVDSTATEVNRSPTTTADVPEIPESVESDGD